MGSAASPFIVEIVGLAQPLTEAHGNSTSFAERYNLNMRMQMRRFTRLTTGYSKKIENHIHMVALYTVWYNWIRTHKAHRVTPAMAAGLTDKLMDMTEVARLIDDAEMRATIQQRAALFALPQSN